MGAASGFRVKSPVFSTNLLLETLGDGPFGPNPGQEPFGARLGHFGACHLALDICFWKPWETALWGQILARTFLEPDLGILVLSSLLLKLTRQV